MEGGHGEDSQASQHALGGPAGHSEEALWVWELAALQAGQVAPEPEQIQVQFLQILLPLLDLSTHRVTHKHSFCIKKTIITHQTAMKTMKHGQ